MAMMQKESLNRRFSPSNANLLSIDDDFADFGE